MLTFKPLKPRHIAERSGLIVSRVETQEGHRDGIRLSIHHTVLKELRWLDGDRLIVQYDDKADAWFVNRVPSGGAADGYKMVVPKKGGANASGSIRVGVDRAALDAILPASQPTKRYDFLESNGNVATFVVKE
jgi:hypothetical protein